MTTGKKMERGTEKTTAGDQAAKQPAAKQQAAAASHAPRPAEFKVFVGQLPFSATQADVEEHFKASAAAGGKLEVRLLTTKADGETAGKSKGMAFIGLSSREAVNAALALHQSTLLGRAINVELAKNRQGGGDRQAGAAQQKRPRSELGVKPGKPPAKKGKVAPPGANKAKAPKKPKKPKSPTAGAAKAKSSASGAADGGSAASTDSKGPKKVGRGPRRGGGAAARKRRDEMRRQKRAQALAAASS